MLTLDLTVRQGDFALRADWSVPKGVQVAVMGPSGAGKSTLVSVIGGFFDADGSIIWDGARIDGLPPGKRPVATLFQDNNLFPHLTAEQNVALGVRPSGRLSDAERRAVKEMLATVGLPDLGARKPGALSGGQQGRVALARAMMQDRPILLLDEPFSALGPALKSEMIDLVTRLASEGERTVLMVTHDPEDARRMDQTVLVADGAAHPPAPTGLLLDDPPEALRAYLG
ncbi:Thiamine import ATP-binding protein ThiQ [Rhodobacteraceae bacterium THAF1]|uniref:thiamine ABC transporter ATP-binding protein n=1 Tax=Palleronia sp. THAF1 TaxID=2587842 RepID=UPI000F3C9369|nr:ATP-binding cassette domain-containing protein [Palleronia sp. THAF1]QFU07255.1 Thiamine import ATP-binding protein ThiQ [Palleronia sp. THAF1]VDC20833.1 Thiamine import ATP-binding protein ThiQ [Rhodobacteraceae bacterium THAF1]